MSNEYATALERIISVAEAQLDMANDALGRPGMNHNQLRRNGFEFIIKAMQAELATFAHNDELSPEMRGHFAAFLEKAKKYETMGVDVNHHLIELSEDWSCAACGNNVVAGAHIAAVKAGRYDVELECKACRSTTPLTRTGMKVFRKLFGTLLHPVWNPEGNGFRYNGS